MTRQARRGSPLMVGLCLTVMGVVVYATVPRPTGAQSLPSAQDVIGRVLTAARHLDVTSADVLIQFRVGEPMAGPPQCVFRGALYIRPDRSSLTLAQWTSAPICWVIQKYVLGRLLEDRDHAASLLPLFRFEVIGEKLVDGHPHYLVYGRALTPKTDPQWMMGWVDFDRGLVTDGTVRYRWGEVDSAQEYGLVAGTWVPIHQDIVVPRFGAALEISYGGFRFGASP